VLSPLLIAAVFTGCSQLEDPLFTSHEMMTRYVLPSITGAAAPLTYSSTF
jgi:hypothetical protein